MSNVSDITKESVQQWLTDHKVSTFHARDRIGRIIHDITGNKTSPTGTILLNRALNAIESESIATHGMVEPDEPIKEMFSRHFRFELDTSTEADDVFLVARGVDVHGETSRVWIARGPVDEMEPLRLTFQSLLDYTHKHD